MGCMLCRRIQWRLCPSDLDTIIETRQHELTTLEQEFEVLHTQWKEKNEDETATRADLRRISLQMQAIDSRYAQVLRNFALAINAKNIRGRSDINEERRRLLSTPGPGSNLSQAQADAFISTFDATQEDDDLIDSALVEISSGDFPPVLTSIEDPSELQLAKLIDTGKLPVKTILPRATTTRNKKKEFIPPINDAPSVPDPVISTPTTDNKPESKPMVALSTLH